MLQKTLIGTILFSASNIASADCKDEWICVDALDQGGNVELRAINLREFPITYTLRIRARNLIVDGPETVTRTLSGNTGHTTMPHLHFAVYRATEWGQTQSIPVRFQSAGGIIERPRRGARHRAL